MKWTNIKLIFNREVRDQLRDRRTLFTIAVLPLVLYPLMGMSLLHIAQFLQEHVSKIQVIGGQSLPETPALIVDHQFAPEYYAGAGANLLELEMVDEPTEKSIEEIKRQAEQDIQAGKFDVVLYFPPQFALELDKARERIDRRRANEPSSGGESFDVPGPRIFVNQASGKSRITWERVERVLAQWRKSMVRENLEKSNIPMAATEPFVVENTDVAQADRRRAAMWSKILPFILLIWALTGAFYPAVDLCAGEKERGTLETLLSSPATRPEIVWGKLLTVMVFSMGTSVLNLASMGLTGSFVMGRVANLGVGMTEFGAPPLIATGWLLLALPLISALFSALSLAIAAFARSSKEGQYYLMPLLLIILPLMMLPMLPAAELDLGTSLIPVTGMMLLLRALMEGQYSEAMVHAVPVIGVTLTCCFFAIRWAIDQFRNESVLFRESERWGLGLWLRHLMRDRNETPSFAEAILCGIVILLVRFFAAMATTAPANFTGFVVSTVIMQVALIATPALLMAVVLTRSPRQTLLLRRFPPALSLPAAVLTALVLHPVFMQLHEVIRGLYPISPDTEASLQPFLDALSSAPLTSVLLLMALLPAVCEELAFRGFILSGLRHMGHKWLAILLSSFFFGITHGILQQSLAAFFVGAVIGYIAVQTGSLLPAILFHFTHNALSITLSRVDHSWLEAMPWLEWFFTLQGVEESLSYRWPIAVAGGILGLGLLFWFRALPYLQYAEEKLQEALEHERAHLPANAWDHPLPRR